MLFAFKTIMVKDRRREESVQRPSGASLFIFFFLIILLLVDKTSLDFVEDNLMGGLEGFFETFFEGSVAGLSAGFNSCCFRFTKSLGGRVKNLHESLVLKRVLLALGCLLSANLLHAEL